MLPERDDDYKYTSTEDALDTVMICILVLLLCLVALQEIDMTRNVKEWVVVNPHNANWLVNSFNTESEATSWTINQGMNDDSMMDCEVMRKREAIDVYGELND